MKFQESKLAHFYLDGLKGLEIGGSAHNPFGLNTLNVDYSDDMDTVFKTAEEKMCGEKLKVDIVSDGIRIPVEDESYDFIVSSHVIEHIFDPIGALKEWYRIIKPGGYIYTIAPITKFVPNETRPTTTISELIDRHDGVILEDEILDGIAKDSDGILGEAVINGILYDKKHGHWTVLDLNLFRNISEYLGYKIIAEQEKDDKVGNGFTVVIQKI
jgi:SAM-dependent methyltransferase